MFVRHWNHPDPFTKLICAIAIMLTILSAGASLSANPTAAATNDRSVNLTLTILARDCEINGGTFSYTIVLTEDGEIDVVYASCSGKDGKMCQIWGDGDFICSLTRPETTIQQQVSAADATSPGAALTQKPNQSPNLQAGGTTGVKVDTRADPTPSPEPEPEPEPTSGR